MLIFAPCNITFDGVALPNTFGGATINFNTMVGNALGASTPTTVITGGSGSINFYSWNSTIELSSAIPESTFAEMVFTSTKFILTLYSCMMEFAPETLQIGNYAQQPIKFNLFFKPDATNRIFKLEEI